MEDYVAHSTGKIVTKREGMHKHRGTFFPVCVWGGGGGGGGCKKYYQGGWLLACIHTPKKKHTVVFSDKENNTLLNFFL